jgi:exodeoxyribonuclease-1
MSFVFYDTETTGISTSFDQILQFAAIRTDADLNELERINVRCQLHPYVIPHPAALRITGVTIDHVTDRALPSHYEMVRAIRLKLLDWSPAIFVGYNSIRFDEHLLRQALFKTLHRPYLTADDGNCRADALGLVQAAAVFAPECLDIPCDPKGKRVFKLDQVAPNNGHIHDDAHDALGDVLATIHLARCVKERAPEVWNRFVRFSKKAAVADFVENEDGFVLTEFYFGKPYHYVVGHFATDADQDNVNYCLTLGHRAAQLSHLTDEQLVKFVRSSPKPIRRVKSNGSPIIMPLDEAPADVLNGMAPEEAAARAQELKESPHLIERLLRISADLAGDKDISPHMEERIYDEFVEGEDLDLMDAFHLADWPARPAIVMQFKDERLRHHGLQLLYDHAFDHLGHEHRDEVFGHRSGRLHEEIAPKETWLTITAAVRAADEMLLVATPAEAEPLQRYRAYVLELADVYSAR